ncbi:PKD [Methanospirillum hungatei JF-1]|uniref:PKD n=1 Tax=Methanospirillum hungatei JF-1 (strain ATCC 27890 / DSM 864 / NBRC 100397 / JF-1) TaxID=323259 RepID=Q2FSR0_METHJ|nr:PKD domain-containing protein [Methanospirillum hungatei]ABD42532.1 PKD [Methanospirillum hungatei JF-1]
MMDGIRIIRPAAMLAVLLCLLMMTAGAVPPLPAEFYGKVTVDGTPASIGTALIAKINDQVRGKIALSTAGTYGGTGIFDDKLVVAATEDDVKSGSATISFYIGDKKADQTVPFEPGVAKELDLTVGNFGADFTANPTSGAAPLTVQFTDTSTTEWSVWTWDFGDGGSSVIKNPSHVYETPGTYTVKMTVGSMSGTYTVTKDNYITVTQSGGIVADFTATPTSGTAPLTVQFTDTSTGSPTMWAWDFGDGTTEGMIANPSHTYQNAGTYTVKLTASSATGGSSTKTKEGYITVTQSGGIVANFTAAPTSGTAPLTVQFTDTSTGGPTMWSWDFGDGTTEGMLANPSHTYQNAGTYTVKLTASSATGGSSTKIREGYITVSPSGSGPTAAFTVDKRSGPKPLTVQFTDQSTGGPTMWAWDFGDGGTSMVASPSYTYQEAGVYTVSLTASNTAGSDTKTEKDYISVTGDIPPPVAMFEATPLSGSAPLTVQFTDLSIGPPTSYAWDFGDGGTSTEANPSHVYSAGGTYTVKLTVKNSGGSHTMTRENYISVGGSGIIADFSGTPTSGTVPLTVQFTDLSTGGPTMWAWDFGDGGTSTVASPSYTYQTPGTYTVKLTASSQTGGTSTKVREGYITVSPSGGIIADFVGTPTSGNAPLTVQFSDRSQGGPTMWSWVFGDGGTALVANPVHVYQQPGKYTVSLTASNQASSNTAVKTDYVTVSSGPVGSGSIRIIYAPDRSSVYLDNALKGETKFLQTFRIENLPAGSYQLKVTKPGFSDYYVNVPVTSGRATEVVADMRLQPSQNGILSVYTYPAGSTVYVDGVEAGTGPLWLADVTPGMHQVRVSSAGYLDWNQAIDVKGGGSVNYVTAALYPSWWTPIYGYVMISSMPGNGVAYLDGVAQGKTPVTLSQVSPGQHTIRIELPGYQPWEQVVNVMEGRTSYVLAQMTTGGSSGTTPVIVASAGNTTN